jgi:hypothetical protein
VCEALIDGVDMSVLPDWRRTELSSRVEVVAVAQAAPSSRGRRRFARWGRARSVYCKVVVLLGSVGEIQVTFELASDVNLCSVMRAFA